MDTSSKPCPSSGSPESLSNDPPGLRPAAEAQRVVATDLAGTEPATVLGSSRCTPSLGLGPRADRGSGSETPPREDCGCHRVVPLLERCEADPAFGRREAEAVREHLDACPRCTERHARRLSSAIGLIRFHERRVPEGLLDDLYAVVRARSPYAPIGGGMSSAFLDGPRSLRLWRTTAAAAVLVLGVGATWTLSDRDAASAPRATPVPLTDARTSLLEDLETAEPRSGFTTVAWPEHRAGQRFFWGLRPSKAASERAGKNPSRD